MEGRPSGQYSSNALVVQRRERINENGITRGRNWTRQRDCALLERGVETKLDDGESPLLRASIRRFSVHIVAEIGRVLC
jgi:hypothetical protein